MAAKCLAGICMDCQKPIRVKTAKRCRQCASAFVSRRYEEETPTVVRFWRQVAKTDGCWFWTGSIQNRGGRTGDGYGRFSSRYAHRMAWELTHGPIPYDRFVLHKCDTTRCVNPDHLFLGSAAQNTRDMLIKGRHKNKGVLQERCIYGHEFTHRDPKTGWRKCRTCQIAQWQKQKAQRALRTVSSCSAVGVRS